jgi:predicted nucleic acid-binding protein
VTLMVDTSVWSLAFRRDGEQRAPQVSALRAALDGGDSIVITGIILQELLQGFTGPKARREILEKFAALPMLMPDRTDHVDAAELRNLCRRAGVQLGTVDALIAQLCIRHDLLLLTVDGDFVSAAKHSDLEVWRPVLSPE